MHTDMHIFIQIWMHTYMDTYTYLNHSALCVSFIITDKN